MHRLYEFLQGLDNAAWLSGHILVNTSSLLVVSLCDSAATMRLCESGPPRTNGPRLSRLLGNTPLALADQSLLQSIVFETLLTLTTRKQIQRGTSIYRGSDTRRQQQLQQSTCIFTRFHL